MLELRDVHFSYGSVPILFGISLDVQPGEMLAVLGTNGAGKSTLLRIVAGLSPPSRGTVRFRGQDVSAAPAEQRRRDGLALVVGGKAVFPDLTVAENLDLGGFTVGRGLAERIDRELTRFPRLAERRSSQAGSLSGGERQQLAIAMALVVDPVLLCIDELSLGLSPVIVDQLHDTLRQLHAEGTTCVLVEQSLDLAARLCSRAVFLEKGEVRFAGDPVELLERGDLARAVFLGGGPR